MSMYTVGTCGICGGAVQVPMHWGGDHPPEKICSRCGATAKESHGPTLPMNPSPSFPIRAGNPDCKAGNQS